MWIKSEFSLTEGGDDNRFNVRLWLEADIHPHSDLRPLYPRKQTFLKVTIYVR